MDGRVPRQHAVPETAEAVASALLEANAVGSSIVVCGGRTRLEIGNAPTRYDLALDLTAMSGIVEHEPGDLTATVLAGTTLAELGRTLAPHGQFWPVEAARPESATVGGVLAGAAPGSSRLRYGHPRDWTIGVRAVLGDGTMTRAGGRVVKNVTGYDLTRFYAGSYGTLCVLVEASLKLWPTPAAERTLVARFARADDAYDALSVLRADRVEIDAAVALDSAAAAYAGLSGRHLIAVRSRGPAPTVSRVTDQVAHAISAGRPEEASSELWNDVAEAPHRAAIALRVSVPESRIRATVADQSGSLHYVGSGIAYLLRDTADAAWIVQRRAEAESADGACVVERAPAALRSAVDTWGRSPVPLPLARRLKSAFDPKGVLSPGRFAGGI